MHACMHVLCMYMDKYSYCSKSEPILDMSDMGAFFGTIFFRKDFLFACTPMQMSFLTISNENIFFKNQGTRLGVIVAPNKGLE